MRSNKSFTKKEITEDFILEVLSRKRDFIEALEILGDMYTRSGDIESRLIIDRFLVTIRPLDPVHYYNLACDYALIGDRKKAMMYLEIAITLGFSDIKHLKKDPDLANLRTDSRYEKLITRISARRIK